MVVVKAVLVRLAKPVSPWGTPAKGYRTRNNKRTDNMIVRRRYSNKGLISMARSLKKRPICRPAFAEKK